MYSAFISIHFSSIFNDFHLFSLPKNLIYITKAKVKWYHIALYLFASFIPIFFCMNSPRMYCKNILLFCINYNNAILKMLWMEMPPTRFNFSCSFLLSQKAAFNFRLKLTGLLVVDVVSFVLEGEYWVVFVVLFVLLFMQILGFSWVNFITGLLLL